MSQTAVLDRSVETLAAAVAEFIDGHGELLFANHGDWHSFGDLVSIKQMAEQAIARNNCFRASCFIMDLMDGGDDFGGSQLHILAVAGEEDYHAALVTRLDGRWYVIDFTARQFDPELPFPYIAEVSEWKAELEDVLRDSLTFCGDPYDMDSTDVLPLWNYNR